MPLKGLIQPDHMPIKKFRMKPLGLLDIVVITMSGLEKELETTALPDRTEQSSGNTKAGEFTMTTALHHEAEMAALNLWFKAGQDPVLPGNKLPCTFSITSISGDASRDVAMVGVRIKKKKYPDVDMNDEGTLAVCEWTLGYDDWSDI